MAVVATTVSGDLGDQLPGGGEEFAVVGERHDPQRGRVQHGGAAPGEQRRELVGAAGGGDPDGEPGERPVRSRPLLVLRT